jgi:hypothetical protein
VDLCCDGAQHSGALAQIDVGPKEQRQLRWGTTRLQHTQRLTLLRHQKWCRALGKPGDGTDRGTLCGRSNSRFHQTPEALARELKSVSGPVTGINTLAAWLIHSDRSSVVGSRPAAGCARRNTDEAPPRQLGFAGRRRRDISGVPEVFIERFSGMATTSLCRLWFPRRFETAAGAVVEIAQRPCQYLYSPSSARARPKLTFICESRPKYGVNRKPNVTGLTGFVVDDEVLGPV